MSKPTATLSPQLAALLRGALYTDMQRACEDAPATSPAASTRGAWLPILSRLNADTDGLDSIGWDEPDEPQPVTITLAATMIQALEADADHWRWSSEQTRIKTAAGRQRAAEHAAAIEQFLVSLSERPTPLMIPTAAIPLVRECAREGIPMVCETIERPTGDLCECARRLIALSDLLDLIGWDEDEEPTEDVDATAHAGTLTEIAPSLLDTLKQNISEYDDDDPEKGQGRKGTRLPHRDPHSGSQVGGRLSHWVAAAKDAQRRPGREKVALAELDAATRTVVRPRARDRPLRPARGRSVLVWMQGSERPHGRREVVRTGRSR